MQVHHETFNTESTETCTFGSFNFEYDVGTVEVTFQGKTFTAKAKREKNGEIIVQGFVGKYRTGTKLWAATVWSKMVDNQQQIYVEFGRDDRQNFHKANIFYNPVAYENA